MHDLFAVKVSHKLIELTHTQMCVQAGQTVKSAVTAISRELVQLVRVVPLRLQRSPATCASL